MRFDHYIHFETPESRAELLRGIQSIVTNSEKKIMSAISDFATKQNAHNAAIADDLTAIKAKIDEQTELITTLQNSAGTLTTEDQATLDALEASNAALQSQADAAAGKTPPEPPTE